jgi:DNA polymerase-1
MNEIVSKFDDIHWSVGNPDPGVFLTDNYLVLDFETTNRDFGTATNADNRIVLSTYADASDVIEYTWGNQFQQEALLKKVRAASFIVAHNAKFELQWLHNCGLDLTRILVYDTMLGEYVLAGNLVDIALDLDSVAGRYGLPAKNNLIKIMMNAGICPSEMPKDLLLKYGKGDTSTTKQIFLKQREILKSKGLLPCMYTRCLTTVVLADIERNGMQLDKDRVTKEYDAVVKELGILDDALHKCTGGINLNSPKQLAKFIYEDLGFKELTDNKDAPIRTPAGGRKTDGDTLLRLEATTDAQVEFQKLLIARQQENTKLKSIGKMYECVQESGILYAQFNQAITQTHRLSSTGARYKLQFQNFYRPYKKLFRAKHRDWRIGEVDGAQLEFRVAAHIGRDAVADADIRNHHDVHKATASQHLGKPVSEVTKEERQNHKGETFRPLYGSLGTTAQQKRYAKYFHERYKGIYDTQTKWTYEVLANKQLVTECGLIFYWPDTSISSSGYIKNRNNIFNYPVQSLATAEIIPISLVYFWHRAKAAKAKMEIVSTIHDSIITEVPSEEEELFNELAVQCFTNDTYFYLKRVYNIEFTVPLGVEAKIGAFWGEGEGKSWDILPPVYK